MNKFLIDWYSKKQATVETATYGSEYISARTCVDQIVDLRTTLRYLGVPIRDVSYMFGDNGSVINSSSRSATLQVAQETQCPILSSCSRGHCIWIRCVDSPTWKIQPCRYLEQELGIPDYLADPQAYLVLPWRYSSRPHSR
jgi:hypothetical protein